MVFSKKLKNSISVKRASQGEQNGANLRINLIKTMVSTSIRSDSPQLQQ